VFRYTLSLLKSIVCNHRFSILTVYIETQPKIIRKWIVEIENVDEYLNMNIYIFENDVYKF